MGEDETPKPYTVKDLAELSGYAKSHIRKLCREEKVPGAIKIGRDWQISKENAEVWLKKTNLK